MSDIEYDQAMMIESIIEKKMRPIYWIVGTSMLAFLTIFVTIALPIQTQLMEVTKTQQKVLVEKANKSEVDEGYLQKWQYYQIEEDEHRLLLEALNNNSRAKYILSEINDNIKKQLGFKYTLRGESK